MKIIIAFTVAVVVHASTPTQDDKVEFVKTADKAVNGWKYDDWTTSKNGRPEVYTARDFKSTVTIKVIEVLQHMMTTIENENAEDEQLHAKHMCWCDMVNKHVTASILESEALIKTLTRAITDLIPQIEETQYLIEKEKAEVEQIKLTISVITAQINNADIMQRTENKRIMKILTAIDHAIAVLKGFHLVGSPKQFADVGEYIKESEYQALTFLQTSKETPEQAARKARLYKSAPFNPDSQMVGTTYKKTLSFGSGFVFGVLSKMDASFETKLKQLNDRWDEQIKLWKVRRTQLQNKQAALERSIALNEQKLRDLRAAKVTAEGKLAAEEKKLIGDTTFLIKARQDCNLTKYEFENIQRFRQEEVAVLVKVIQFIEEKGNWELFDSVASTRGRAGAEALPVDRLNVSFTFLQESSENRQENSEKRASVMLTKLAQKYRKTEYSDMANSAAKGGAWDKVFAALAKLKKDLEKEKAESTSHWSQCTTENGPGGRIPTAQAAAEAALATIRGDIDTEKAALDRGKADVKSMQDTIAYQESLVADLKAERAATKASRAAFITNLTKTRTVLDYANGVLSAYYNSTTKDTERAAAASKRQFIEALKQREMTYTPVNGSDGKINATVNSPLRWEIAPRPYKNRPVYSQEAKDVRNGRNLYDTLAKMVSDIDDEILTLQRYEILDAQSLSDQLTQAKTNIRLLQVDIKNKQIQVIDTTTRRIANLRDDEDEKEIDIKDLLKEARYWTKTCPDTQAEYDAYQALIQEEITDIDDAVQTLTMTRQTSFTPVKACLIPGGHGTICKWEEQSHTITIPLPEDAVGDSVQARCAYELKNGYSKTACVEEMFYIQGQTCICFKKDRPCGGVGSKISQVIEKDNGMNPILPGNKDIYVTSAAESAGRLDAWMDFATMC